MARPQKCRCICSKPEITGFSPEGCQPDGTVTIGFDEYETIRLLDYIQLTQEECARKMNISRPTVTRIYNEARRKMADAIVNGKHIRIAGGDVIVCPGMKPECVDEVNCCHRKRTASAGQME